MIRIIRGDITELEVDAIVNAANSELMVGGGVDYAIHIAAGPGLESEVKSQHNYLAPGKAIITSGYRLPAKYVIHTVAPIWNQYEEEEALRLLYSCYNESLSLALKDDIHSVAFPSLGTGAFGIPLEKAIPVALQAISDMLEIGDLDLTVTISCFSQSDYEGYIKTAEELGAQEVYGEGVVIERRLPDCPLCFHPLKRIAYGMIMPGPHTEDLILGGCTIMGNDPDVGCKNCHWEGHKDALLQEKGEALFAIIDEAKNRFAGGAIFEVRNPTSFKVLVLGFGELKSQGATLREVKNQIESCESPSLWLAPRHGLVGDSLPNLMEKYRTVTAEVMEFLGYRQIESPPMFQDSYIKG